MCILILLVIPACVGLGAVNLLDRKNRSAGLLLPVGYLLMLLVFELITVPILFLTKYENFKYVMWIYTPIVLVLTALGIITTLKRVRVQGKEYLTDMFDIYIDDVGGKTVTGKLLGRFPIDYPVVWIIALVILVLMLILAQTRVIFDGDDAYYVVQSLITQQNGTMYVTQPYTGRAAPIDMRHALAVFTMWITWVGQMTGLHTTIVCHTVLPLVLLPLTVVTYAEMGLRLLRDKKIMLPYFVVFIELMILFGRVSIYTSEAFLLARTWQGKSMAANLLIPMTFLAMLILFGTADETEENGQNKGLCRWILLLIINAVAGIFSSLAVILVSLLMLVGGFVLMIREKSIRTMISACLCCVPGLAYMLLYVYFTYFGWR